VFLAALPNSSAALGLEAKVLVLEKDGLFYKKNR
jgi:hypothetical protein